MPRRVLMSDGLRMGRCRSARCVRVLLNNHVGFGRRGVRCLVYNFKLHRTHSNEIPWQQGGVVERLPVEQGVGRPPADAQAIGPVNDQAMQRMDARLLKPDCTSRPRTNRVLSRRQHNELFAIRFAIHPELDVSRRSRRASSWGFGGLHVWESEEGMSRWMRTAAATGANRVRRGLTSGPGQAGGSPSIPSA